MFKKFFIFLTGILHYEPTFIAISIGGKFLKGAMILVIKKIAKNIILRYFQLALYWLRGLSVLLFAGALVTSLTLGLPLSAIMILTVLSPIAGLLGFVIGYGNSLSPSASNSKLVKIKKQTFDFVFKKLGLYVGKRIIIALPVIIFSITSGFLFLNPISMPLTLWIIGCGVVCLGCGLTIGLCVGKYKQWRDRRVDIYGSELKEEIKLLKKIPDEDLDKLTLSHESSSYCPVRMNDNTINTLALDDIKELLIKFTRSRYNNAFTSGLSYFPAIKARQKLIRLLSCECSPYTIYSKITELHERLKKHIKSCNELRDYLSVEKEIIEGIVREKIIGLNKYFPAVKIKKNNRIILNGKEINFQYNREVFINNSLQVRNRLLMDNLLILYDLHVQLRILDKTLKSDKILEDELNTIDSNDISADDDGYNMYVHSQIDEIYQPLNNSMLLRMHLYYLPFINKFYQTQRQFVTSQFPGIGKKIFAWIITIITFPWNLFINRISKGEWVYGLHETIMDLLYHEQFQTAHGMSEILQLPHRERIYERSLMALNIERDRRFHAALDSHNSYVNDKLDNMHGEHTEENRDIFEKYLMLPSQNMHVFWTSVESYNVLIEVIINQLSIHSHDKHYKQYLLSLQKYIEGQVCFTLMLVKNKLFMKKFVEVFLDDLIKANIIHESCEYARVNFFKIPSRKFLQKKIDIDRIAQSKLINWIISNKSEKKFKERFKILSQNIKRTSPSKLTNRLSSNRLIKRLFKSYCLKTERNNLHIKLFERLQSEFYSNKEHANFIHIIDTNLFSHKFIKNYNKFVQAKSKRLLPTTIREIYRKSRKKKHIYDEFELRVKSSHSNFIEVYKELRDDILQINEKLTIIIKKTIQGNEEAIRHMFVFLNGDDYHARIIKLQYELDCKIKFNLMYFCESLAIKNSSNYKWFINYLSKNSATQIEFLDQIIVEHQATQVHPFIKQMTYLMKLVVRGVRFEDLLNNEVCNNKTYNCQEIVAKYLNNYHNKTYRNHTIIHSVASFINHIDTSIGQVKDLLEKRYLSGIHDFLNLTIDIIKQEKLSLNFIKYTRLKLLTTDYGELMTLICATPVNMQNVAKIKKIIYITKRYLKNLLLTTKKSSITHKPQKSLSDLYYRDKSSINLTITGRLRAFEVLEKIVRGTYKFNPECIDNDIKLINWLIPKYRITTCEDVKYFQDSPFMAVVNKFYCEFYDKRESLNFTFGKQLDQEHIRRINLINLINNTIAKPNNLCKIKLHSKAKKKITAWKLLVSFFENRVNVGEIYCFESFKQQPLTVAHLRLAISICGFSYKDEIDRFLEKTTQYNDRIRIIDLIPDIFYICSDKVREYTYGLISQSLNENIHNGIFRLSSKIYELLLTNKLSYDKNWKNIKIEIINKISTYIHWSAIEIFPSEHKILSLRTLIEHLSFDDKTVHDLKIIHQQNLLSQITKVMRENPFQLIEYYGNFIEQDTLIDHVILENLTNHLMEKKKLLKQLLENRIIRFKSIIVAHPFNPIVYEDEKQNLVSVPELIQGIHLNKNIVILNHYILDRCSITKREVYLDELINKFCKTNHPDLLGILQDKRIEILTDTFNHAPIYKTSRNQHINDNNQFLLLQNIISREQRIKWNDIDNKLGGYLRIRGILSLYLHRINTNNEYIDTKLFESVDFQIAYSILTKESENEFEQSFTFIINREFNNKITNKVKELKDLWHKVQSETKTEGLTFNNINTTSLCENEFISFLKMQYYMNNNKNRFNELFSCNHENNVKLKEFISMQQDNFNKIMKTYSNDIDNNIVINHYKTIIKSEFVYMRYLIDAYINKIYKSKLSKIRVKEISNYIQNGHFSHAISTIQNWFLKAELLHRDSKQSHAFFNVIDSDNNQFNKLTDIRYNVLREIYLLIINELRTNIGLSHISQQLINLYESNKCALSNKFVQLLIYLFGCKDKLCSLDGYYKTLYTMYNANQLNLIKHQVIYIVSPDQLTEDQVTLIKTNSTIAVSWNREELKYSLYFKSWESDNIEKMLINNKINSTLYSIIENSLNHHYGHLEDNVNISTPQGKRVINLSTSDINVLIKIYYMKKYPALSSFIYLFDMDEISIREDFTKLSELARIKLVSNNSKLQTNIEKHYHTPWWLPKSMCQLGIPKSWIDVKTLISPDEIIKYEEILIKWIMKHIDFFTDQLNIDNDLHANISSYNFVNAFVINLKNLFSENHAVYDQLILLLNNFLQSKNLTIKSRNIIKQYLNWIMLMSSEDKSQLGFSIRNQFKILVEHIQTLDMLKQAYKKIMILSDKSQLQALIQKYYNANLLNKENIITENDILKCITDTSIVTIAHLSIKVLPYQANTLTKALTYVKEKSNCKKLFRIIQYKYNLILLETNKKVSQIIKNILTQASNSIKLAVKNDLLLKLRQYHSESFDIFSLIRIINTWSVNELIEFVDGCGESIKIDLKILKNNILKLGCHISHLSGNNGLTQALNKLNASSGNYQNNPTIFYDICSQLLAYKEIQGTELYTTLQIITQGSNQPSKDRYYSKYPHLSAYIRLTTLTELNSIKGQARLNLLTNKEIYKPLFNQIGVDGGANNRNQQIVIYRYKLNSEGVIQLKEQLGFIILKHVDFFIKQINTSEHCFIAPKLIDKVSIIEQLNIYLSTILDYEVDKGIFLYRQAIILQIKTWLSFLDRDHLYNEIENYLREIFIFMSDIQYDHSNLLDNYSRLTSLLKDKSILIKALNSRTKNALICDEYKCRNDLIYQLYSSRVSELHLLNLALSLDRDYIMNHFNFINDNDALFNSQIDILMVRIKNKLEVLYLDIIEKQQKDWEIYIGRLLSQLKLVIKDHLLAKHLSILTDNGFKYLEDFSIYIANFNLELERHRLNILDLKNTKYQIAPQILTENKHLIQSARDIIQSFEINNQLFIDNLTYCLNQINSVIAGSHTLLFISVDQISMLLHLDSYNLEKFLLRINTAKSILNNNQSQFLLDHLLLIEFASKKDLIAFNQSAKLKSQLNDFSDAIHEIDKRYVAVLNQIDNLKCGTFVFSNSHITQFYKNIIFFTCGKSHPYNSETKVLFNYHMIKSFRDELIDKASELLGGAKSTREQIINLLLCIDPNESELKIAINQYFLSLNEHKLIQFFKSPYELKEDIAAYYQFSFLLKFGNNEQLRRARDAITNESIYKNHINDVWILHLLNRIDNKNEIPLISVTDKCENLKHYLSWFATPIDIKYHPSTFPIQIYSDQKITVLLTHINKVINQPMLIETRIFLITLKEIIETRKITPEQNENLWLMYNIQINKYRLVITLKKIAIIAKKISNNDIKLILSSISFLCGLKLSNIKIYLDQLYDLLTTIKLNNKYATEITKYILYGISGDSDNYVEQALQQALSDYNKIILIINTMLTLEAKCADIFKMNHLNVLNDITKQYITKNHYFVWEILNNEITPLRLMFCINRIPKHAMEMLPYLYQLIKMFGNKNLMTAFIEEIINSHHNQIAVLQCFLAQNIPINVIKYLIEQGMPVYSEGSPDTLLHIAVKNSNIDAIKYLINLGKIPINYLNAQGQAPIHIAAQNYQTDIVTLLLDHNAKVDLQEIRKYNDGLTPLMYASKTGNIKLVKLLIAQGADPLFQRETYSEHEYPTRSYAITDAIVSAHKSILEYFFDDAAIYNRYFSKTNEHNLFCDLCYAATKGYLGAFVCLYNNKLKTDENYNSYSFNYKRLLTSVVIGANLDILKLVLNHNKNLNNAHNMWIKVNNYLLIDAVKYARVNFVNHLYNNNADINQRINETQETLLMLSASNGDLAIVNTLLRFNANIGHKDTNDMSALIKAATHGHLEIVKTLISNQYLNTEQFNDDLKIALIHATTKGHMHIIEFLLDRNVNVNNVFDNESNTPLMLAIRSNHIDIVMHFLKINTNVNITNQRSQSSLALAWSENRHDMIPLLLNAKANPNIVLDNNKTLLNHSIIANNYEMFTLLLNSNVDINYGSDIQNTLSAAAKKKDPRFIRELAEIYLTKYDLKFTNNIENMFHMALLHAIEFGSKETLMCILNILGNVSFSSTFSSATLIIAVERGNLDILKCLTHKVTSYHESLLADAARYGHLCIVQYLIDQDRNTHKYNEAALQNALESAYFNIVEYLLKNGAACRNNQLSFRILNSAIDYGNFSIVNLVLNNLHTFDLTIENHFLILRKLLMPINYKELNADLTKHGILNITIKDTDDMTIILYAAKYNCYEMLCHLHEKGVKLFTSGLLGRVLKSALIEASSAQYSNHDLSTHNDVTFANINQLKIVKYILDQGINVNETDLNGYTALMACVEAGNIELLKFILLEANIKLSLNIADKNGETALIKAAKKGSITLVKLLEQKGAKKPKSINRLSQLKGAFIQASKDCNLDVVVCLLYIGVSPNYKTNCGHTPLMFACMYGYYDLVELLLVHRANIQSVDNNGMTPLTHAQTSGHYNIMTRLLENNPKPIIYDNDKCDWTLLMFATRYGLNETITQILKTLSQSCLYYQDKFGRTTVILAAIYGYLDIIKLFLQYFPTLDLNFRNKLGYTAFKAALDNGHYNIVTFLYERGIIPDIDGIAHKRYLKSEAIVANQKLFEFISSLRKAQNSRSELIFAAKKGYLHTVDRLLQADQTTIDIIDEDAMSALMWASALGHTKVVERLLSNTQQPNIQLRNKNGVSAFTLAVLNDRFEIVTLFLFKFPKLEIHDIEYETGFNVILLAVISNRDKILALLLNHEPFKLYLDAQSRDGLTVLMYGARKGLSTIIEILLPYVPKHIYDAQDMNGMTALMFAAENGYHDIVQMLLIAGSNLGQTNKSSESASDLAFNNGYIYIVNDIREFKKTISHHQAIQQPKPNVRVFQQQSYACGKSINTENVLPGRGNRPKGTDNILQNTHMARNRFSFKFQREKDLTAQAQQINASTTHESSMVQHR